MLANTWSSIRARFLLWEWAIPMGVVALILWRGGPVREYLPELTNGLRSTFYGTLASISAGLLGFVIAGVTILLTMGETPRIKKMADVGMLEAVVGVFNSAARWLAFGVVAALAGLVLDRDHQTAFQWFSWLVTGITVVWVLRVVRSLWVLEQVVGIQLADRKKQFKKRTLPFVPADEDPRRGID